jgi:hypothetical protein
MARHVRAARWWHSARSASIVVVKHEEEMKADITVAESFERLLNKVTNSAQSV